VKIYVCPLYRVCGWEVLRFDRKHCHKLGLILPLYDITPGSYFTKCSVILEFVPLALIPKFQERLNFKEIFNEIRTYVRLLTTGSDRLLKLSVRGEALKRLHLICHTMIAV